MCLKNVTETLETQTKSTQLKMQVKWMVFGYAYKMC